MPRPTPYTHGPTRPPNLPTAAQAVIHVWRNLTPLELDRLDRLHRNCGNRGTEEAALNTAWTAGLAAGILDTGRNPNLPALLTLAQQHTPAAYLATVAAATQHLISPQNVQTLTRAWTLAKLPWTTAPQRLQAAA